MKPIEDKQRSLDEGISDYFEQGLQNHLKKEQPKNVYQRITDFLSEKGYDCAVSEVVENTIEIVSHQGILYVTDPSEAKKLATYSGVDISEVVGDMNWLSSLRQAGIVEIRTADDLSGIGFVFSCADSAMYEGRESGAVVYQGEQFEAKYAHSGFSKKEVPFTRLPKAEQKKVDNRLLACHDSDSSIRTTGGGYAAEHEQRQDK